MKNKMGILEKSILTLKLRAPRGVTLNEKESQQVIDDWSHQVAEQDKSAKAMVVVADKTERQVKKIDAAIIDTAETVKAAKNYFAISKNPVKKDVWARRLVLAVRCHNQLRESKNRLEATTARVRAAVEDAKLVKTMLDARIEEAKIYKDLNGGLKLVGQALADARNDYSISHVEYKNYEFNMEALENEIESKPRESILQEAERYINQ